MPVSHSMVIGCWIVFGIYWLLSSFSAKRTAEHQGILSALAHRIPLGLGVFLLVNQRWTRPMNRVWIPRAGWVLMAGAVVCLAGLFVTLWARWTLAGNWSSDVTFKQGHELVISGPYRLVRHPIYTGLLIMFVGTALNAGGLHGWLAVVPVVFGFWIKLRQEENLLLRHFPEAYPDYCRRVKAVVPFVL